MTLKLLKKNLLPPRGWSSNQLVYFLMMTISESKLNILMDNNSQSELTIIPAELATFWWQNLCSIFFLSIVMVVSFPHQLSHNSRIMRPTLTFDFDLTLRELGDDSKNLRHVDFGIRANANKRDSAVGGWRPNRKWKVKRNPTATRMTLTAEAAKPSLIKSGTLSACD